MFVVRLLHSTNTLFINSTMDGAVPVSVWELYEVLRVYLIVVILSGYICIYQYVYNMYVLRVTFYSTETE